MTQKELELLEFLKFELKFLEDGSYGQSPHAPHREAKIFQDSPSCLNFGDPARPHPCGECWMTDFVPLQHRTSEIPCRYIPVGEKGETLDELSQSGNQLQMEEALARWLRSEIERLQARLPQP
jgi:hypothetical protein